MSPGDELAARIGALSPGKRALLERLRSGPASRAPDARIARRPAATACPLSFAQEGLWLVDRLRPSQALFTLPAAWRLSGALDHDALQRALDAVVARHDVLRMRFGDGVGGPVAVVDPASPGAIDTVDLTGLPPDRREREVHRRIEGVARRPFDLARGPLLRVVRLALGPDRHVLALAAHHSVCDARSIELFFQELAEAYAAERHGRLGPGTPLPIQYSDYAAWQRDRVRGPERERLLTYWAGRLADLPELVLPTDRAPEDGLDRRASQVRVTLPRPVADRLAGICRGQGATPFMGLVAAWLAVFHAASGQTDVAIGMPVIDRPRPELANLIGFFTNTLVLRVDLSGDPDVPTLLQRVRATVLGAIEHQAMPFSELVTLLRPKRCGDRMPLVRATVGLHPGELPRLALAGLDVERIPVDTGVTPYDLSVLMVETAGEVAVDVTYAAALFDAPTIERLASRFVALLERMVETPESRLATLTGASGLGPAGASAPLTRTQQLVWVGQQLRPDAPAYNEGLAVVIEGPVDVDRFRRAFALTVASADALRARIAVVGGVPVQWFPSPDLIELEVVDLSGARDWTAAFGAMVTERSARVFDPATRLWDSVLVRLGPARVGWILALHQLVTDGWSFGVIYRRLLALYQALDRGASPPAEFPQFRTVIADEQRYLAAAAGQADAAYWRAQTSGPAGGLACYGEVAAERSTRVVRVEVPLRERGAELTGMAAHPPYASLSPDLSGLTLFLTVLSAFLARVATCRDVVIGVPIHNRSGQALRETVGLVMTVCPLRITVEPGDDLPTLAGRIRQILRETLPHARYATANAPNRRVYDALLNYQPVEFPEFSGHPTTVRTVTGGHGIDALALNVQPHGGGYQASLDLNVDAFPEPRRRQAVDHLLVILDAALARDDRPIAAIDLATPAEQATLIAAAAAPARPPVPAPVIPRILAQARATPEAIALVDGGRHMSYRALGTRVERLAGCLRARGLGTEDVVALCCPSSLELIVGLLGVLASGAAALPLDPEDPPTRRAQILEQAGATLLLTHAARVADGVRVPVLRLDADWETVARDGRRHAGAVSPAPESAAYLIFTSGSSGLPKGVVVPHRALAAFADAAIAILAPRPGDRVLQFASPAFDTAFEEILPALATGATLVMRPAGMVDAPAAFLDRCARMALTIVDLPTAYWRVIAGELALGGAPVPASLRQVVIGGEAAPTSALHAWRAASGHPLRVVNTYGPTETTVAVSWYAIDAGDEPAGSGTLPIGQPIPGAWLLALSGMGLVPPGVVGELALGGAGVARGYHGRPALTAERFRPAPPAGVPGSRVYLSGDHGRLAADGQWGFMGRTDRQVKVRGQRVELDEIETRMRAQPGVLDAAVWHVAARGEAEGARVHACFTGGPSAPSGGELRQALRGALPGAMVPDRIAGVTEIPRTSRGKIDYRALATAVGMDAVEADPEGGLLPRTHEERAIARIWAALLDRDVASLGIRDDFFDLGGHSLLGTQLVAHVGRHFAVAVPLRALFDAPTIEGLALAVVAAKTELIDDGELDELLAEVGRLNDAEIDELLVDETFGRP